MVSIAAGSVNAGTLRKNPGEVRTVPERVMKRSAYLPVGNMNVVVPQYMGASQYTDAFYGSLDMRTGEVKPIYTGMVYTNREDYDMQTGAVRDGILYIPQFVQDMVTMEIEILWKRVDLSDGRELEPLSFGSDTNAYFYSMTYDSASDRFVGLAINMATGAMGTLAEVRCSGDGAWKAESRGYVGGTQGDFMAGLTWCPADGEFYGLKDDGRMYIIDMETGDCMAVREFDDYNEYFMIPDYPYPTPLGYSTRDRSFVTVYPESMTSTMTLGLMDFETYDVVKGPELEPTSFVATLYCTDPYAEAEAPAQITGITADFTGGSLSGNLVVPTPSDNFSGDRYSGDRMTKEVRLDGEVVFNAEVKTGEETVLPLELSEGVHTVVAVCIGSDGLRGPETVFSFYVGYDAPCAPTGLLYRDGVLTWNATGAAGQHNGYVDVGDIAYNVRLDGVTVNASPVTECRYVLDIPDAAARREITVTSLSHGNESEPSASLSRVVGQPLSLPVSLGPDKDQADLFQTLDVNGDGNVFVWGQDTDGGYYSLRTANYYEKPDDWLFLPPVNLPVGTDQYRVAFDYVNSYMSDIHFDNLEVWVGTSADPESMTDMIYSHTDLHTSSLRHIDARFIVSEPRQYVIGIYAGGGTSGQYRGVSVRDFEISAADGATTAGPGRPEVKVTALPKGELGVSVAITAPVETLAGNPMGEAEQIEYTVSCGEYSSKVTASPGAVVETTVQVPENGYNVIRVEGRNAVSLGLPSDTRLFVGMDTAVAVDNLKGTTSDDNRSLTVTWNAPEIGRNGGYVNPEGLRYKIYLQNSANPVLLDTVEECSYTYTQDGPQAKINLGVRCVDPLGQESDILYAGDMIGVANELPMIEEFNSMGFTYGSQWRSGVEDRHAGTEWESVSNLNGLGYGDPVFAEGGLMCINMSGTTACGELLAGKFSTLNTPAACLEITYWDFPYAGDMRVVVRSAAAQDEQPLAELVPERGSGSWEKWIVALPENLLESPWVQLNIETDLQVNQRVIIDRYAVTQDVAMDFKVASIDLPYSVFAGEVLSGKAQIINSGRESGATSVAVDLLADGEVVETVSETIARTAPGDSYEVPFGFIVNPALAGSMMEVRARLTDPDQVSGNDERSASFVLFDNVMPVVTDLSGKDSEGGVSLSWSRPDLSYGGMESFEATPAFEIVDSMNGWLLVDRDGKEQFSINGLGWDGDDQPSSWVVFDAEAMGTLSDERLCPHTGTRMLIARSIAYDEGSESPTQNSDWLISPEVVGGTVVDFWMNTISSTYSETVAIYYSTTDRDPESFVKGRNFTKSGSEAWEHLSWTLPADARYFAFVYESWGTFAAMIDDIIYTPVSKSEWTLESYDVWRAARVGEAMPVATGVKGESYLDTCVPEGNQIYYVTVNASRGDGVFASPLSNPAVVETSGIGAVDGSSAIGAGRGYVLVCGHEGETVGVFSADGLCLVSVTASDRELIRLEPGIYIVAAGSDRVTVRVR